PPSKSLTGPAPPRRPVCAPAAMAFPLYRRPVLEEEITMWLPRLRNLIRGPHCPRRPARRPHQKPLLLECLEDRCVPSTLYVPSPPDNGARGTLRYEIAHAANGDTIEMSSALKGPIVLSQGELLLKKNLTIEGLAGQPETISGNGSSRVFEVA